MKKVVCFLRVSSVQQDLDTQRKAVIEAIRKDGYRLSEIAVVEGKESAIKNDEMQRQTLNEMKDLIENNESIKDVYFYAIDRLARKVSIVLSIVDYCTARGVNLHFLNPYPMQTLRDGKEDAMGKMFLTFLSIGAEMEMTMKKARFADTREKMRNEGKLVVGSVLYGYYRDSNGYPQVKDDEAEIVRRIFNEYVYREKSMRAISRDLIIDGIWENRPLCHYNIKISNIINNPAYSGRQAKQFDSKQPKLIKYPAIVDIETQDKAMEISAANSRPRDTTNIYYAKGLVKFVVNEELKPTATFKGNASYVYVDPFTNKQLNISVNVIDSVAEMEARQLYKIYKSYENFTQPQEYQKEIEECEKKIDNLTPVFDKFTERENRITRAYTLGRMTDEMYDEEFDEIMREKQVYINEKNKLENQIRKLNNQIKNINWTKEVEIEANTDEEIRDLVQMMIERIEVTKLGKYEYSFEVIPNQSLFKIGLARRDYLYNCSGGKKRLIVRIGDSERDIADIIKIRFQSAGMLKRAQKKVVD